MAVSTYYFDTPTFASATSIYSDASLTTFAPDDFYSDNIIVREQVNGVLLPGVACGGATPTLPTLFFADLLISGFAVSDAGVITLPTVQLPTGANTAFTSTPASFSVVAASTVRTLNISVVVPAGYLNTGATITGTTTATQQPVAPSGTAVRYYRFVRCYSSGSTNNAISSLMYYPMITPPVLNGRYLEAETQRYYRQDAWNAATLEPVSKANVSKAETIQGTLEYIPGALGCPTPNPENIYWLRRCSDQSTDFFMNTGTTIFSDTARVIDTVNNVTYMVIGALTDNAGTRTQVHNIQCADFNNVAFGASGFTNCATYCSTSVFYTLEECGYIQNKAMTVKTTSELPELNINTVIYSTTTGKAYRVTSTSVLNTTTSVLPRVLVDSVMPGGCP
jgi:hypothetical protein